MLFRFILFIYSILFHEFKNKINLSFILFLTQTAPSFSLAFIYKKKKKKKKKKLTF